MQEERIDVRTLKDGTKIYYEPSNKNFKCTLMLSDETNDTLNKTIVINLQAKTEKTLLKKINKRLKLPPIKAVRISGWRIVTPYTENVVRSGKHFYAIGRDGRKRRISPYDYRKYDEDICKELVKVNQEHRELTERYNDLYSKLKGLGE